MLLEIGYTNITDAISAAITFSVRARLAVYMLPCRHICFFRTRHPDHLTAIPFEHLYPRWVFDACYSDVTQDTDECETVTFMSVSTSPPAGSSDSIIPFEQN